MDVGSFLVMKVTENYKKDYWEPSHHMHTSKPEGFHLSMSLRLMLPK